jgi:hypothetical protein
MSLSPSLHLLSGGYVEVSAASWQPQAEKLLPRPAKMPALDWNDLQYVLAVARDGWKVERAMGIENTAGAHSSFGIMKLRARRELRAIFV